MPRDEELRRVAEDVRALARSLARDFWDAAEHARGSGGPVGESFYHGLRSAASGLRRGLGGNVGPREYGPHGGYGRYRGCGPYGWHRGRWWAPGAPPPPGAAGGPPGSGDGPPGAADPPGGPPGQGAPWNRSGGQEGAPGGLGPWGPGPWGGGGGPGPWGPGPWAPWHAPRSARRHGDRGRRPAPPPVRHRWDASTLVGLLIVLFGAAWLLGGTGAVHLPAEAILAAGLTFVGASMIVTGRTDWSLSRRSWPVWLGGILLVILVVTSSSLGLAGTFSHVSFGRMDRTARSGGTVYGGFGTLRVDATGVAPGASVNVDSAAGQTYITTPPGVPIQVRARILGGRICVSGRQQAAGVGANIDRLFSPGLVAPVTLEVHQLAGQIFVDGETCQSR